MQDVIVLNCGSSSIKFAIMNAETGRACLTGLAENIGNPDARIKYKSPDTTVVTLPTNADHKVALSYVQAIVEEQDAAPAAVGHRVVHGGETFTQSVLINDDVKRAIAANFHMAPLHNPANLLGIESAQHAFPELPQIAVFDTAFFQSMPQHAYMYALPRELYEKHGIRRYGFHGSSHYFVSQECAKLIGKPIENTNAITAHLGNGCSIAAIKNGKAVDTSLGFTPLEGLVMGTRCGDLDPSLPSVIAQLLEISPTEVDSLLNRKSGLLGLSGLSNDCRTLETAAAKGDQHANLALTVFCYRLAKYIASYLVATGPIDALVFTGGIGENSSMIRDKVVTQLTHLGFNIDPQKNLDTRFGAQGDISASGIPTLVIPTNEEWVIAKDAIQISQLAS